MAMLQQHTDYDLLHGDDNPSCKACSGSLVLGISIPVPPPPAASHRGCPRPGSAISQPSSSLSIPNPLLRMEQIKDEGQHQGISTYSSFRLQVPASTARHIPGSTVPHAEHATVTLSLQFAFCFPACRARLTQTSQTVLTRTSQKVR